jgi:hypothetical protein
VTTPPLPAKNRPSSSGPEMQGVTPTICVGVPRFCPFSRSLFTQPLNPTDTCVEQTAGVRPGLLRRVDSGQAKARGGGKMDLTVLTGSLELWLLAGRPPTKRVWG